MNLNFFFSGIKTPTIYFVDLNKRVIYLEYFKSSVSVKQYFEKLERENELTDDKIKEVAHLLGNAIAKMHSNNMVHGDLTPSNFLIQKNEVTNKNEIIVIDFGLSHLEASDEDKGVDLYLLERALVSMNVDASQFFKDILQKYKETYKKKINSVLQKFAEVRSRGRKRCMVG